MSPPRPISALTDETDVAFEHRWPALFNLGDFLCSPRHYFRFRAARDPSGGPRRITIVGGGAFNELGRECRIRGDGSSRIAWGIGRSVPYGTSDDPDLPFALAAHCEFSTRDPDLASLGARLVPCVSVMHDLVDLPVGDETGLFLNQNPAAGGSAEFLTLAAEGKLVFGTNGMAEHDFTALFSRTARLVTNSYHAAYWGLLSGRDVAIIGYSSKFENLLALFGLRSEPQRYGRGNVEGLWSAVAATLARPQFVRLPDHRATTAAFREMNRGFAKRLVERGLLEEACPCSSAETLQQRMLLLQQRYATILRTPD